MPDEIADARFPWRGDKDATRSVRISRASPKDDEIVRVVASVYGREQPEVIRVNVKVEEREEPEVVRVIAKIID